ncbi:MAG TPA: hypothetical protein VNO21_01190 [Polyangiaceae bacterium]|nr:hypothetical protein [Polyangiaceae bacterium]
MKSKGRALRVMLVANDGFSAGHVVRALSVARGLAREGARRGLEVALLLATTSEVEGLGFEGVAVMRLPAPVAARRAGVNDGERRRLVAAALDSVGHAFAPDLLVVDTFPSGPHGEVGGLLGASLRVRRALIRRDVPVDRAEDPAVVRGLARYDLVVVADDPVRVQDADVLAGLNAAGRGPRVVHVPPVTLSEAEEGADRATARARLELPRDGRAVLVAAGGGGDLEAVARARDIAATLAKIASDVLVVLAIGPLGSGDSGDFREMGAGRARVVRVAPMQPWLAAFDGAIAAAGYNTAHELAKARVPCALFAQVRPFDDQAARVRRFVEASLAFGLERFDEGALRQALVWMQGAPHAGLPAGGADHAAAALLDLACAGWAGAP